MQRHCSKGVSLAPTGHVLCQLLPLAPELHPTTQICAPSELCREASVLTGPCAGRALPEGVLVGDLGQVLAQLLCTLWRQKKS